MDIRKKRKSCGYTLRNMAHALHISVIHYALLEHAPQLLNGGLFEQIYYVLNLN